MSQPPHGQSNGGRSNGGQPNGGQSPYGSGGGGYQYVPPNPDEYTDQYGNQVPPVQYPYGQNPYAGPVQDAGQFPAAGQPGYGGAPNPYAGPAATPPNPTAPFPPAGNPPADNPPSGFASQGQWAYGPNPGGPNPNGAYGAGGGFPPPGGPIPPGGPNPPGQWQNGGYPQQGKSNSGLILGGIVVLVLVFALAIAAFVALRPKGDDSTTASGATTSARSPQGGAARSGTSPTEEPDALLPPSSDESSALPEETALPPGPLKVRYEVESSSSDVTVTYVLDDSDVEQEEVSGTWSREFTSDSTPFHYFAVSVLVFDGGDSKCRILVNDEVAVEDSGRGTTGMADCSLVSTEN